MKQQQPRQRDQLPFKPALEPQNSCSSLRSSRTCDTQGTNSSGESSSSSSSCAASSATAMELDESRRLVRSLRREAKARATELARLRIQVEALSIEREGMKKYRDMCESAMAESRDLRAERDELKEILLSVMQQEGGGQQQQCDADERDAALSVPGRRRTSNFSDESEDEKHDTAGDVTAANTATNESFCRGVINKRNSSGHRSPGARMRRPSLIEGVGCFFSGVVKGVTNAGTNSLHNLEDEVEPQAHNNTFLGASRRPQRSVSAVVSSMGHSSFRSLTSIEERSGSTVELDEKRPPSKAMRHSSMPMRLGEDSASSLSSWNIKGGGVGEDQNDNEDDDDSINFLSWDESRRSASLSREDSFVTAPQKGEEKEKGGESPERSPEQTPENDNNVVARAAEPRPDAPQRRGSTASRRGSTGSVGSAAGRRGSVGRRRSSCFVASRRNTEKDVEDFVSSMMLGGDLRDLLDDAEIAADFEDY